MKNTLFFLITIVFLISCGAANKLGPPSEEQLVNLNYLKSNLEFLASDELEGREATTRGEKIASLYIAKELQKYSVKPYGNNGTYFQYFDLKLTYYGIDSQISLLKSDSNKELTFNFDKDFISVSGEYPDSIYASGASKIVFVGYGRSDQENYDDYANLNVNGKTVLILPDEPSRQNDFFEGNVKKYNAKFSGKISIAKSMGATGVLFLPDENVTRNWNLFQWVARSPFFEYPEKQGDKLNEVKNISAFILNKESARKFLENEKYNYEQLKSLLNSKGTSPAFELEHKIKYDLKVVREIKKARNVIGVIEGNDPDLKNEFVSLGAHYDHLGKRGELIHNGADDNASGTTVLLEAARVFATSRQNLRSILVIFHAAEEKGLLGALHFTNNFDFIDDIVVNINLDMVGRGSLDSIHCIGSDYLGEELFDIIEEVNSQTVDFKLDYSLSSGHNFRSDHFQYLEQGIPSVFFYDYMRQDYHKPTTDDADKINFTKMIKVGELIHHLALQIANMEHRLTVLSL